MRLAVAIEVKTGLFIEHGNCAEHRLNALAHAGARLADRAAADRASPGEMVIDLAAHHCCLADHGIGQIRRLGRRGVHHHGQRGLQRMGQVAGMGPGFLGLALSMGKQAVEFLDQRLDFEWERLGHSVSAGIAHLLQGQPDAPQRTKAQPGLQHRHDQQAQPEHGKAAQQDPPHPSDLLVQVALLFSDAEPPQGIAARQGYRALHHPQRFVRILFADIQMRIMVGMPGADIERAVP